MRYFKFPKWLKRFYPEAIWDFSSTNKKSKNIYLTFDDGPNAGTTEWIIALMEQYQAKATFFCIGQNVEKQPALYQRIIEHGHVVANHSYSHLNGATTPTSIYLQDIQKAQNLISSDLFRPPYGKIKPKQFKALKTLGLRTVFWSHISYDFDPSLSSEKRIKKALEAVKEGSVIVFHDSDKAFPQLKNELPLLLKKWRAAGFQFKAIKNTISTS